MSDSSKTPSRNTTFDSGSQASLKITTGEASITIRYPMLSRDNYATWAIKMKTFMRAQGVWDAIVSKDSVDERMDQMALAAIFKAIPEDMLLSLAEKKTAKEVWDALHIIYLREDQVKETRMQNLKADFENLRMKESNQFINFQNEEQLEDHLGNEDDEIKTLREALVSHQQMVEELQAELEEERNASSTATSEAMSMIMRLQYEKAEVEMELRQFKRFAEEKMAYDQRELAALDDLVFHQEQALTTLSLQLHSDKKPFIGVGINPDELLPEDPWMLNQKKVDDRSQVMMYLGIEHQCLAEELYDQQYCKLDVKRDVLFDEGVEWNLDRGNNIGEGINFSLEENFFIELESRGSETDLATIPVAGVRTPTTPIFAANEDLTPQSLAYMGHGSTSTIIEAPYGPVARPCATTHTAATTMACVITTPTPSAIHLGTSQERGALSEEHMTHVMATPTSIFQQGVGGGRQIGAMWSKSWDRKRPRAGGT